MYEWGKIILDRDKNIWVLMFWEKLLCILVNGSNILWLGKGWIFI